MTLRLHRVLGTLMGLAALTSAPLVAQSTTQDNTGYGGTAAEFLLLGAGARGAALGGAFAALTNDVTALYYNPAGLAQMSRPAAMVSTYSYVASTRYTSAPCSLNTPAMPVWEAMPARCAFIRSNSSRLSPSRSVTSRFTSGDCPSGSGIKSSRWKVPPEEAARSPTIAETMLPAAPVKLSRARLITPSLI